MLALQADGRDQDVDAREQARSEREELGQLAAGHVVILVPPDGEVLAPARTIVSHHAPSSSAATSYGSAGGVELRLSELSGISPTSTCVISVGTSTWTLVRTCWSPNCQSLTARPCRVRMISSMVVKASAPDGQTVAHIGRRPVLVRS